MRNGRLSVCFLLLHHADVVVRQNIAQNTSAVNWVKSGLFIFMVLVQMSKIMLQR
jgi:hypothetical protein